jgi:hypothetical protein
LERRKKKKEERNKTISALEQHFGTFGSKNLNQQ